MLSGKYLYPVAKLSINGQQKVEKTLLKPYKISQKRDKNMTLGINGYTLLMIFNFFGKFKR